MLQVVPRVLPKGLETKEKAETAQIVNRKTDGTVCWDDEPQTASEGLAVVVQA